MVVDEALMRLRLGINGDRHRAQERILHEMYLQVFQLLREPNELIWSPKFTFHMSTYITLHPDSSGFHYAAEQPLFTYT